MTIALGVIAGDGIVLAADSQETIPGYMKVSQGKIVAGAYRDEKQAAAFAVSGAGDAGYLDYASSQFRSLFLNNQGLRVDELEPALADYLRTLYRRHIVPFSGYPFNERPSIDLLIAAQCSNQPAPDPRFPLALPHRLWISQKNTLRSCEAFEAVGAGSMFAKITLKQIFPSNLAGIDLRTACLLAAYTVFAVKEHIEGCGKETQIVYLKDNSYSALGNDEINALETLFRAYLDLGRKLITYMFVSPSDRDEQDNLGVISSRIRRMHKQAFKILSGAFGETTS